MDQLPFLAREKYIVTRTDGKPVGRTFVIEIDKDPDAISIIGALAEIYSDSRPALADSLADLKLRLIERKHANGRES